MPVRMRFAMHGHRHAKILHLVVANSKKARDARPIETLGIFNPRLKPGTQSKTIEWSVDRINYWLGVGAEPTKSVVKLLTTGGVLPEDSKYHRAKPAAGSTTTPSAETTAKSTANAPSNPTAESAATA